MTIRKNGVDIATTYGEELMNRYLEDQQLQKETWPQSQKASNPEFYVHFPAGKVLVEIKDFGEDELMRQVSSGIINAGSFSPNRRIVRLVERSFKQLKQELDGNATMCVICSDVTPYDHDLSIKSALYGRLQLSQAVGPEGAIGKEFFFHDATIDPQKQISEVALFSRSDARHISSVAFIEIVSETRALRTIYADNFWKNNNVISRENLLELVDILESEQVAKFGPVDEECVRLRVYHNPNAATPLSREPQGGLYDRHTWVEDDEIISVGYEEPVRESLF